VWDSVATGMTTDTIETEVGNMMLTAGVEASAYFDVQILHSFIECVTLSCQARAEFSSQPA